MSTIERSIDVRVPVRTAYDQWTQFESFPQFMKGVEQVKQVSDTMTHWITKIAGTRSEFDAEITEQHPDERIAWHSVAGPGHAGVVTFHRLSDETTRIMLQLEYRPQNLRERLGGSLGLVERQVYGDLKRFKNFIESQGTATGAWRGNVERPPS